MIWTAWNNGQHHHTGAGYGFKVDARDRDSSFRRDWKTVEVRLPGRSGQSKVLVNIDKASFWGPTCREVISREIGVWLMAEGYAPWPDGQPPRFEVENLTGAVFEVTGPA